MLTRRDSFSGGRPRCDGLYGGSFRGGWTNRSPAQCPAVQWGPQRLGGKRRDGPRAVPGAAWVREVGAAWQPPSPPSVAPSLIAERRDRPFSGSQGKVKTPTCNWVSLEGRTEPCPARRWEKAGWGARRRQRLLAREPGGRAIRGGGGSARGLTLAGVLGSAACSSTGCGSEQKGLGWWSERWEPFAPGTSPDGSRAAGCAEGGEAPRWQEGARQHRLRESFCPFPRALPRFGSQRGERVKARVIKVMDLQKKERLAGLKFTAKPGPEMTPFLLLRIFFALCGKMQLVSLTSGNGRFVITARCWNNDGWLAVDHVGFPESSEDEGKRLIHDAWTHWSSWLWKYNVMNPR